jgi:diguanylate cyclase (GGDEF)-like protein
LFTKLFVPLALFSVGLIALMAGLAYTTLHREITQQYNQRARGVALLLVDEIGEEDLLNQPAALSRSIRRMGELYPEFYRISVYAPADGSYRVIASTDDAYVNREAEPHDLGPLRTGEVHLWEGVEEGRRVLEVNSLLRQQGRTVAVLGAHISLEERDRKLADLLRRTVAISVLAFLGLLGLLYLILRSAILRPLYALTGAARRVATGDFEAHVPCYEGKGSGKVGYELVHVIRAFNAMILRIRRDRERLRELAIRDPLTGLCNRRYFEEATRREIARARRDHQPFTVAIIDVDGLREVNNRFGHLAGDELLRRAADFLKRHTREADELIRWGGDEFLILMPQTDLRQAARVAERLKAALAEWNRGEGAQERLSLTPTGNWRTSCARPTSACTRTSTETPLRSGSSDEMADEEEEDDDHPDQRRAACDPRPQGRLLFRLRRSLEEGHDPPDQHEDRQRCKPLGDPMVARELSEKRFHGRH